MPRRKADGTMRPRYGLPSGPPDLFGCKWRKYAINFYSEFLSEWDEYRFPPLTQITRNQLINFALQQGAVKPLAKKSMNWERERDAFSREITEFMLGLNKAAISRHVARVIMHPYQIKYITRGESYEVMTNEKSIANGFETTAVEGFAACKKKRLEYRFGAVKVAMHSERELRCLEEKWNSDKKMFSGISNAIEQCRKREVASKDIRQLKKSEGWE